MSVSSVTEDNDKSEKEVTQKISQQKQNVSKCINEPSNLCNKSSLYL